MALPQQRFTPEATAEISVRPAPQVDIALAGDTDTAAISPAHVLQGRVGSAFAPYAPEARWKPRRTVAFVVTFCGGFWFAVGFGIWSLVH